MLKIILALFLFIGISAYSPVKETSDDPAVCLSEEEYKLYKLIRDYRIKHKLPDIPLSGSLTLVAQKHVENLNNHPPDRETCNFHSWSESSEWKGCCYTADHKEAECMWQKPSELTSYKGYGFEIAFGSADPEYTEYVATAEEALAAWQKSPGHNNVILNKEVWQRMKWQAIGIAVSGGYAVVWFGAERDEADVPKVCPN